jgi:hypothetical protein
MSLPSFPFETQAEGPPVDESERNERTACDDFFDDFNFSLLAEIAQLMLRASATLTLHIRVRHLDDLEKVRVSKRL